MADMGPAAEAMDPVVVHLTLVDLVVVVVLTLVDPVAAVVPTVVAQVVTLVVDLVAMVVTVQAALVEVAPVEVVVVLPSVDQATTTSKRPKSSL